MPEDPEDSRAAYFQIRKIWRKTSLIVLELAVEAFAYVSILLSITAVQKLLVWVHGGDFILFVDTPFAFNFKWLFDAANVAMLVVFVISSIARSIKIISGHFDD